MKFTAYERYSLAEAMRSRTSYKKIHQNKVRDSLLRQFAEQVEPGGTYKLDFDIKAIDAIDIDNDTAIIKGVLKCTELAE